MSFQAYLDAVKTNTGKSPVESASSSGEPATRIDGTPGAAATVSGRRATDRRKAKGKQKTPLESRGAIRRL